MNKITVSLLFIFILIFANPLYAGEIFGGAGATPMPINSNDARLAEEHIVINGVNLGLSMRSGHWDYNCDFVFKNVTNKTLTFEMGFPLAVYDDTVPEEFYDPPPGVTLSPDAPLVSDFKVTMNGKPLSYTRKKILSNIKLDFNYRDAYVWKVTIPPLGNVTVHNHYLTGISEDPEGKWIKYALKAGQWHDARIEHLIVEIVPHTATRLCSESPDLQNDKSHYQKPDGLKIIGQGKDRKYIWDLRNWSLESDLNLCLQPVK